MSTARQPAAETPDQHRARLQMERRAKVEIAAARDRMAEEDQTGEHPAPTLEETTAYAAELGLAVIPSSYRTGRNSGGNFASIDTTPEGYRLECWHETNPETGRRFVYGEY